MTTTYAAAPLWAPTLEARLILDRRARLFAAHLAERYFVISPHDRARVLHSYPLAETEDRAAALAWCLAEVERIYRAGGRLDVLLRDDATLSAGCAQEVQRWRDLGGEPWVWEFDGLAFWIVRCP